MINQADFRAARTCPIKLLYRQRGYPTTGEYADITALLAEQTAIVAAVARRAYPEGRAIPTDLPLKARLEATAAALDAGDDVTLFDAVVASGGLLAHCDILIRQGDALRLLAVAARGLRPERAQATGARPSPRAEWQPLLEHVAFQWLAVAGSWPHLAVRAGLVAPRSDATEPGATLIELDVTAEVAALLPDVGAAVEQLQSSESLSPRRDAHCRACEYRTNAQPSGFAECWGEPGDGGDHLLDLVSLSTLPDALLEGLIESGKTSLLDVPESALGSGKGSGSHRERQRRQLRQTRLNAELIEPALSEALARLPFPLHFVDFETLSPAVPRYDGMRPAEVIAFQWSCHTVTSPDTPPVHAAWLQTNDRDPTPAFATALRAKIGDTGAILVWSNHERSVLQGIRRRLGDGGPDGLAAWLDATTAGGRIVDLQRLAARYYYHPLMGGKTTVKAVLGAVWASDGDLRARYPEFATSDRPLDNPYRALPPQRVNGQAAVVRNGAGAALAYLRLMGNGTAPPPEEQATWRALLGQYCRLDTLAMVMIWEHWRYSG